jgi:hypothetical protein
MEVRNFPRFCPQSKHEISTKMIKFLYYAYVGISSRHVHIALIKANESVATAPFLSNLPQSSPMVDVANWDNDVYLAGYCNDAPIGSRFAESEPYTTGVVSHPLSCSHRLSPQQILELNVCSFEPASQCHQRINYSILSS